MPPHRPADKQKTILDYIRQTIDREGYAPTIGEIKTNCGLSTTSLVHYHLQALKRSGKIEIVPYLPRGIRIT